MKWNLFTQPLGTCSSDGYQARKEIPLAVPIVMGAASVVSSLWGAKKSADANKQAQARLAAERAETEAERTRRRYETWGATASGQNTIRMLRNEADREWKRLQGAAAVGGASDAAVAQQKELSNMKQAEVIAQANANFEDKKDAVDASYRQDLSRINQQQIAQDQQHAQNVAAAAGQVSGALMQGALSTFGGTKLGQQWLGGSPVADAPGTVAPTRLQQMGNNYKILNPYLYQILSGSGTV